MRRDLEITRAGVARRKFMGAVSSAILLPLTIPSLAEIRKDRRMRTSLDIRKHNALTAFRVRAAHNEANCDEALYPNKVGSYHKGLPHNALGEVDQAAYRSLVLALHTGSPADFENIVLGGNTPLADPQGGLAVELEGSDPKQTLIPPAPPLASAWRAGEAVEEYWMALLRDIRFGDYESDPLTEAALRELNHLSDFRGPKQNARITAQTLFRGFTSGDQIGPYVSQFLLQPVQFGALTVDQQYVTFPAKEDQLTRTGAWLPVQNGQGPFQSNPTDSAPRYIHNGRDLTAYVHSDPPFQAYLVAAQWLLNNEIPFNASNPYNHSLTQSGFATFGVPHLCSVLAEAANCALRAVWYHKWFVHRTLRPEAYGGLVHWTITGKANYPLGTEVLNSEAVDRVFRKYGTYLLPQAYVEGCPQHPSYGQGHAAIAGACVTVLKAFFNTDSVTFSKPVQASRDGTELVAYDGPDRDRLTITNELHKLASNISLGRDIAGIHWRSDYDQAISLGEAVAINLLRDQTATFNEAFRGFTFTKFDGKKVTV